MNNCIVTFKECYQRKLFECCPSCLNLLKYVCFPHFSEFIDSHIVFIILQWPSKFESTSVMNTYSCSSLAKHLSEKCWLNLQFLAMYYITIPLHWYFSENYYILLPKEYVQLIIILLPTKCYVKTKAFTQHYHKLC